MHLIGIDLGGTKIAGVRADEHGNILARELCPTLAEEGPDAVTSRVVEVIEKLLSPGPVAAVGVASPGPIDTAQGIVKEPPNLPGWGSLPLRKILLEKLGSPEHLPMTFVHDAGGAALGEFRFGAGSERLLGRRIKNLLYLGIGTGIGGAVIIDGCLLPAAELGHISIDLDGPRCNCGNRGCLEVMASGTALAAQAVAHVEAGRPTAILDMAGGDVEQITAKTVTAAARSGDPLALELMEREGMLVGVGVVSFAHTFNPELVVIGGGVSKAGDLLFKPLRETVEARVMHAYRGTFEVVPAALGGDSGSLGAVAAALEALEAKNSH